MIQRPQIPRKTQRMLWSESMGHCMNPQCHNDLFQDGANIGELAHIRPNADSGDVSFDNLLALCRHCHKKIDDNREQWPSELLRHWKKNRNSEIRQRFTKRCTSFEDLKTIVVPILESNGRIFDSYGPTGDPSIDVNRHGLWLRFEGELISNNQRLEQILVANKDLLHRDNQKIVQDFLDHAKEFIHTRGEERVSRVRLFPGELNSVFGIERINGSPVANISALQNFIDQLVHTDRFVSLELVTDLVLKYREEGRVQELHLDDRPRVQQLYWSGRFYRPQTSDMRYGSLMFILRWLNERGIHFEWPDVTRLAEIRIANRYSIKFVYKYLLSDFDQYEMADRKNLIVVNLHNWGNNKNEVDLPKTKKVSGTGLHVLSLDEFYRFAHKRLK